MKTLKLLPIMGCLLMLTMSSTCSNDDDDNSTNNSNATVVAVNNTAQQGNWRITYFYDTDHEETAHFANYIFTFGSDGVLTATNGINSYGGTWSVTDSHSGNDDSGNHNSDDVDFNIAFNSPADFAELSDDWEIITSSDSMIELIDISGGNGGTDHLVFEKN